MTPSRGGTHRSTSPEAGVIRPGGAWGEEGKTVEVGANGQQSGGGRWRLSALEGRDNMGDATPLAPPLLLSLSSSSSIAEEDVAGGALLSSDADLDAVPANKVGVINADNDRAMAAVVIAMPDTMGGDDAREVIILASLLSTGRTLISILLVIHIFFLV